MRQVIIYNQDNGVPAIIVPAEEALQRYGIMAIAMKDVPAGKRFKIIDASELPQDVPQEAWIVDDADLTDGVGANGSTFEEVLK